MKKLFNVNKNDGMFNKMFSMHPKDACRTDGLSYIDTTILTTSDLIEKMLVGNRYFTGGLGNRNEYFTINGKDTDTFLKTEHKFASNNIVDHTVEGVSVEEITEAVENATVIHWILENYNTSEYHYMRYYPIGSNKWVCQEINFQF